MIHILDLPNEIIRTIFDLLLPRSLHAVATVCLHWSNITQDIGFRSLNLLDLDIRNMIAEITEEIPTANDGAGIRHLLIQNNSLLRSSVFDCIQRLCPNLVSFDYDYSVLGITTRYERRHLLPSSVGRLESTAHVPSCHDNCQIMSDDVVLSSRLGSLHIGYRSSVLKINKKGYYHLNLTYLPRLTELTIHMRQSPRAKFKETVFNVIHRLCPELETLSVCDTDFACVFGRKSMSVQVKLQVLKLENVTFLHDASVQYFSGKYPTTQVLILSTNYANYSTSGFDCRSMGVAKAIFNMIVRFKCLTKLVVHLDGFDTQEDGVSLWFQGRTQSYLSKRSRKRLEYCKITFS